MAKKIKAIKCPQCGSSKISELRADYYHCNSCGTDFFLDSDDINIYHHNAPSDKSVDKSLQKKISFGVVLAVFFLLISIFSRLCNRVPSKSSFNPVTETEQWSDAGVFPLETTEGKPVYIKVGIMRGRNYEQKNTSGKSSIL